MLRFRLGLVSLFLAASFAASCDRGTFDGPDGFILDAQPRFAVRGRQAAQTIAIRGDDTHWASEGISAEDVSFGQGIEITRIAVANDRYMEVDLRVLPDADLGYRDIVVGGLPFAGIFRVADPFRVVAGTPIRPGRFFRAVVEGTETQWIDGVEVTSSSDQVMLDGNYFPLGSEELRTDVISEHYLEVTGYAHWYAFNGTGGEIDLLVGLGPVEERDLGVGTLEVEAEPRRVLAPDAVASAQIEEDLGTHVYELMVPEFSYCGVYLYPDGVASDMVYEIYRPTNPGRAYHDLSTSPADYDAEPYTFAPAPLYVVVHDEQMRGGEGFGYSLEFDCDFLEPEPLLDGVPLARDINGNGFLSHSKFFLSESPRWAINTYTVTPEFANYDFYLYVLPEGPYDRNPDGRTADDFGAGAAESLRHTAGMRPRSVVQVYAEGYYDDPLTAFTMTRTEEPMPGGTIYENVSPLDIPDTNVAVLSPITVAGAPAVATTMHVAVDITHTAVSDVVLELSSPQGQTVVLLENDFQNEYFSGRDILTMFPDLTPPTLGDLEALAASGNPNGTWTLRIRDSYGLDAGQLNGWALTFE